MPPRRPPIIIDIEASRKAKAAADKANADKARRAAPLIKGPTVGSPKSPKLKTIEDATWDAMKKLGV